MAMNDGGRRLLQGTMAVLAGIPFVTGVSGIVKGPSSLPGGPNEVTPTLDNEYRFVCTFLTAVGPTIWYATPHVERQTTLLRAVGGLLTAGSIARVLAWRESGRPHPIMVAATGLELVGAPILLAWQRRVAALADSA